ncbi:MAG: glycosyltransferase [Acidobacteria bacterium]|nr:glycosyltransferase [Acidobacteriota bacterium]MCB9396366.1 glycosyltransferase [Acidobacteriota bacterium]
MTRRFLSIFPFFERGHENLKLGRLIANADFFKALLRSGSFDEYWLSGPAWTQVQHIPTALNELGLSHLPPLKILPFAQLPKILQTTPFHACHLGGWGYFMAGLHNLRQMYACEPFPITAMIHSLDGKTIFDQAVRLNYAECAPFDAIFCSSRAGQSAMQHLNEQAKAIHGRQFCGQLPHIPLGVDEDLLRLPTDPSDLRKKMRIEPHHSVVLVPGRISSSTKMDLLPLLRHWNQWTQQAPFDKTILVIAGGAESGDLQQLSRWIEELGLRDTVRVRANFPYELKASLYSMADVVLSPSDNTQETFGLTLLEAKLFGKPVIASDWNGYRDLIRDGIDGYLIPTYSAKPNWASWWELFDPVLAQFYQSQMVGLDWGRLKTNLQNLLKEKTRATALGQAGAEHCRQHYVWSQVIHQFTQQWQQLKAQAAVSESKKAAKTYYPSYEQLFATYPTTWLGPTTRLAWAVDQPIPQPNPEWIIWLDERCLKTLLQHAQPEFSLAEAAEWCQVGAEHLGPTLAWLIKAGCLKVC